MDQKEGTERPEPVFQQNRTRYSIVLAFWAVVLIGLPPWWITTSIERLTLPTGRVSAQQGRMPHFPISVQVSGNFDVQELVAQTRSAFQEQTARSSSAWRGLDVRISPQDSDALLHDPNDYRVVLRSDLTDMVVVQNRSLLVTSSNVNSVDLPSKIASTLAPLLSPFSVMSEASIRVHKHRIAKYAPRYRLSFSLLNEDSADGDAALSWDIKNVISKYLNPSLDRLRVLHNFTIESQVQAHAPLAFTPLPIEEGGGDVWGLTPEQLTVFINSAEWTLSSGVTNDPVLHFVIFVPSASKRPLKILDEAGKVTESSAFLVPQWGGIFILNRPPNVHGYSHLTADSLELAFTTFRTQLYTLLGVHPLPKGVFFSTTTALSEWQLDAVLRQRALANSEATQQTLGSIINLVDQIDNMPVGQDVRGSIQDSLDALEKVYGAALASPELALRYSSWALSLASEAFFNPGMLALLYFPAEHTLAVYAPLFVPVLTILAATTGRELSTWRKARRQLAAA